MATIKQVATLAGVAPSVVSRLLNDDPTLRIRPDTRTRIHEAVARLQYTPNVAARSLRAGRSGVIAMALQDVMNPVYAAVVAGAQQTAASLDQALFLGDVDSLARGTGTLMRMIDGGALDGLVMQGAGRPSDEVLARFATKVPTVMLQEDPREGITVIGLADEDAARIATAHLLELGHKRIGFITTVRGTRPARDRLRGWRQGLRAAGLKSRRHDWIWSSWTDPTSGALAMGRLLDRSPDLTGVVVGNVAMGIGALAAAADGGYRVPNDLSVVAIHDIPMAEHVRPALTTVQLPLDELGRQAVLLLTSTGDTSTTNVLISDPEPRLIARASTGPPG